jgi:hypothetical protein
MPNVNGMKFPYTAKGKEEAKKAAATMMAKKRKDGAPVRNFLPKPGGPTKPTSPSGVLMQPVSAAPAPTKARAYNEAPKKAMPSKRMIDKKFGK